MARIVRRGLRTCSSRSRRPPGRRTRLASATAARSSGIVHNTSARHGVGAFVGELERLCITHAQIDLAAGVADAAAGDFEHRWLSSIAVSRTSSGYGLFSVLGLIPSGARPSHDDIFGSIEVDYKLFLNLAGAVVFAALFWLTQRRGATDPE